MNTLQKALRLNAVFSAVSGIILILANHQISQLFGTENRAVFWIIGGLLLFFSTTIIYEIFKVRRVAIIWIIIQDFLWVIGSIIILIFKPFTITQAGMLCILFVAIIVLGMAINQYRHLKMYTKKNNT